MYCFKLVYSKNYFNLAKIFVLRLFKMVANQAECSRLEQRSVIKFFLWLRSANYVKFTEEYVMCMFYQKMFMNGLLFKKVKIVFKLKMGLGRPTMPSTPEMVDSVNALILFDRRVTKEDISELEISLSTTHKIMHDDLAFSNVSC